MNGNFKTCARGHYYSATLDHCPYCPSSNVGSNNYSSGATMGSTDDSNRTMDVSGLNMGNVSGRSAASQQFKETKDINQGGSGMNGETETVYPGGGNGGNDGTKTSIIGGNFGGNDDETTIPHGGQKPQGQSPVSAERTMIFEDEGVDEQGQQHVTVRNRRKLVGWLVSYTLDNMGMDFKLYEGRNIIGRNPDCQIIIADKTVSGKHAVILFRAGKYSITDQQSSQGTFVNDEDIELEPRYLKDGDMIRIGQTSLKFRSSL